MKKTLIAITCGLMLALTATTSEALAINDDRYLGAVDPANENPEGEADLINLLLDQATGSGTFTYESDTVNYTRTAVSCGSCEDAVAEDFLPGTTNTTIDLGDGYTYLKAKYGNTQVVWYVVGLTGEVTIPATCGAGGGAGVLDCGAAGEGGGLSHSIAFNPGTTTVPDGGATLGLLGLGMLGLGYLRRRKQ